MKNLLKKFAVMMASVMLMMTTFAVPSFAADPPTKDVTIDGFEKGVTPTAYKIANVKDNGALERIVKKVDGKDTVIVGEDAIADLEKPKSGEILKLAANTPSQLDSVSGQVSTGTTVTIPGLTPGIYLVKFAATSDVKYIYNPIIISVDKDGNQIASNLDSYKNDAWNGQATDADGKVKVKKSNVPFEKVVERTDSKIAADAKNPQTGKNANAANGNVTNEGANVNADPQDGNDGNRGGTAAKGDTVSFRINTKVPYYADNFFTSSNGGPEGTTVTVAPQFQIYDTLDGLTLNQDSIVVYANNNFAATAALKEGANEDYTIEKSTTGFTIKLTEKAIKAYRSQDIEVRYSAVVNDNAERVNFNPDTNTAGCKYSNNPNSTTLAELDKRTTYHYKFTINGRIMGNDGEYNREVIKVGTDESGEQILMETSDGKMTEKGWQPLDGVTFKLYADNNGSKSDDVVCGNVYSEDGGVLKGMEQLDAGVYWLVEDSDQPAFKEPNGAYKDKKYTPNTNPIKIEIRAKLKDDGRLDSYMVLVADQIVGNYKAEYKNEYDVTTGTKVKDIEGKNGKTSFYEVSGTTVGDGAKIEHKHNITKPDDTQVEGNWNQDYGVAADIRNSKVGTLPSTGGMGTIMFTIGGIVIMALALFLLFGGKRKQQQKQ